MPTCRSIGAHGDLVCWSFYPGKNLGGIGDGGAVTTDNSVLAERLRTLPLAEGLAESVLSLPMEPQLSLDDARQIIDAILRG